jgi:AraC-like DNA-binding protein
MSGKLTFVNEAIEELFANHEKLILKFPYNGAMLTLECRILESGLTISAEERSYLHTNPVVARVFVFHKGKARINTESEKMILSPGHIYLLPPEMPFQITYFPEELLYFHLHVVDASGYNIFAEEKRIICFDNDTLYKIFLDALAMNNQIVALGSIAAFLGYIIPPKLPFLAERAKKVRNFSLLFKYLDSHPLARITIEELAELYGIRNNTLSKRFKRIMGISLKSFLIERQMLKAQEMLLYTNKTIEQISKDIGFSEVQYFHRFFKKHGMISPGKYRKLKSKDFENEVIIK